MENSYNINKQNKVKRGAKRATYDKQKINEILDSTFLGFVGFSAHETAMTLPMAYGRIDDKIYLHGALNNSMLLNLIEHGKASMTVMHLDGLVLARSGLHHSVNYRSVCVFGSVKKIEDEILKTKALKSVINHMVPNRWDSLRMIKEKEVKATLVVELTIESASAKIREHGVVDEKTDLDLPVWAGVIPIKQVVLPPENDALLPDSVQIPEHVLNYYEKHK